METFLSTETLIIELLLIATLVAIVVRRLRVPYTVALVVVGLALTFNTGLQIQIDLTPEIILALFVPPLVFEAAFHLDLRRLKTTLLVQGTTMQLLLRRVGLMSASETEQAYERQQGKLMAARAAQERIQELYTKGVVSATTWQQIEPELNESLRHALNAQSALLQQYPALRMEALEDARREGLRAQRAMLQTLSNDGVLSEEIYEELVTPIDAALAGETPLLPVSVPLGG